MCVLFLCLLLVVLCLFVVVLLLLGFWWGDLGFFVGLFVSEREEDEVALHLTTRRFLKLALRWNRNEVSNSVSINFMTADVVIAQLCPKKNICKAQNVYS